MTHQTLSLEKYWKLFPATLKKSKIDCFKEYRIFMTVESKWPFQSQDLYKGLFGNFSQENYVRYFAQIHKITDFKTLKLTVLRL